MDMKKISKSIILGPRNICCDPNENNIEDDSEYYGEKNMMINHNMNEQETRIMEFLEKEEICMYDPEEKKHSYYEFHRHKLIEIKSAKKKTILAQSKEDLDLNASPLLLRRKLKSCTSSPLEKCGNFQKNTEKLSQTQGDLGILIMDQITFIKNNKTKNFDYKKEIYENDGEDGFHN